MWTAEKVYWQGSDNFVRAYQDNQLIWERYVVKNSVHFTASASQSIVLTAGTFYYSYDSIHWSAATGTSIDFGTSGKQNLYIGGDNASSIGTIGFSTSAPVNIVGGDVNGLFRCFEPTDTLYHNISFAKLFRNASALKSVCSGFLPAATLGTYCYSQMFDGCTGLTTAPALPATTTVQGCYEYMFRDCVSLASVPVLSATNAANRCFQHMFTNCRSLTSVPTNYLPATVVEDRAYQCMFQNTGIVKAPYLPATLLGYLCYSQMFYGCSNLNEIHCSATTLSTSNNPTENWVYGVAATGDFYGVDESIWSIGANGIPTTWVRHFPVHFTGITFNSLSWVVDVAASGGTADKDNCLYTIYALFSDGTTEDVTSAATVTGQTVVSSSTITTRHSAGTLTLTASYSGKTVSSSVTIYQEAHIPITDNCISFTASASTTVKLTNYGSNNPSLQYSYNGTDWTTWNFSALTFGTTNPTVYIRGKNTYGFSFSNSRYSKFEFSGSDFSLGGNIMSLIDWETMPTEIPSTYCFFSLFNTAQRLKSVPADFLPATTLKTGCYYQMFANCYILDSAPNLPATTLADSCYESMFVNTNITTAPALPATTLANRCYYEMFQGCTGLTTAPALSATTLEDYCCYHMFKTCTGLISAQALPATVMKNGCYYGMFEDCTGLTSAPNLPATELATSCYNTMFWNCKSLTKAPELPAETLVMKCYYQMFANCVNLNEVHCSATSISATDCTEAWLYNVFPVGDFYGNDIGWVEDSPNGIPTGWTKHFPTVVENYVSMTASAAQYVGKPLWCSLDYSFDKTNWSAFTSSYVEFGTDNPTVYVRGKNTTGINGNFNFYISSSLVSVGGNAMALLDWENLPTSVPSSGLYSLFSGATALQSVSSDFLPATTLLDSCYRSMFQGCTSLTTAPALPATTLANSCYYNMFEGCTSLTTAPALPATTLKADCYSNMFAGCTSLTTAPALPAVTLVNSCYNKMFQGCSLINEIHCDATTINFNHCTFNWLRDVASTGDFYGKTAANWPIGYTDSIPTGWTAHLT